MSGLSGEDRERVEKLRDEAQSYVDQARDRLRQDDPPANWGIQLRTYEPIVAALTRALATLDQQEKALEAADELVRVAGIEFSTAGAYNHPVAKSTRAYRSARATSTKEDE